MVVFPPSIVVQPVSRTVVAGSNATFIVSAAGDPPLSFQWQMDGDEIFGETDTSYTIPNATSLDQGNYQVVITNNYGAITSAVAALTVIQSQNSATIGGKIVD